MISIYFLWFDCWTFKEWKTEKNTESFCLSILTIYTNDQSTYILTRLLLPCLFFSARFLNMCKPRTTSISFDRLAHLKWHFMEEGQHAYWASWGWWMLAGLVPCNQKFSCNWNWSFFKAVPPNRLPLYLGSPLHIISFLLSQFCLFQNPI